MLRLRLAALEEFQYLTCLKHSLWGSRSARFKDWQAGDYLAFIVDKTLTGLARVNGKPFQSKQRVWDKALYPHRIPIKFINALTEEQRIPILGEVRDALTTAWGPKYGWGILNQQLLTETSADIIVDAIRSPPNALSLIQSDIHLLLAKAKQQEKAKSKEKRKKRAPKKEVVETEEVFESKKEESAHSKAQALLIKLGKITGCSVWIASNDRRRTFRGRLLGDGCLKSLPNLGLNQEAVRRISLIDIIWIRQNAPVCAFEVESTTSVYSGLLRMADLLTVVPALKMRLFIVAPNERQDKVIAELTRPTFRKIGLDDFCKFIATEELDNLLDKVKGLQGHIQPTIIDTIGVEVEEELDEPPLKTS